MGRGKTKALQAAIVSSVAAFSATGVFAQSTGITADLTLSTTLSADTNPDLLTTSPGTELDITENLSFSIQSQNSTQLFEVFGGVGLSFSQAADGGNETDVTNPNVTVHYFNDGANANFDANANYWFGDVTDTFDVDPSSAVFLVVDAGTLAITGATLAYNWGLNAPLGFSVRASTDIRDYEGTLDPALFDTTKNEVSGAAILRFSPATQGTFTVTLTDYTSSDAVSTSSETMRYSFGVTHELARALTIDANLGFREKSTTASGTTTTRNGLQAGVDLTQVLANGTVFGGLQYDASLTATSTALTVGRSLDFPSATLSADVTADWNGGASPQILGRATFTQQLPSGSVSANFSQTLFEDSLSQDIKFSRLGVGYQKSLNSNSDINLAFDFRRSEDARLGTAATKNRARLSATYSRNLSPVWDLSVGYLRQQNSGSAITTATSDKVFLTLARDIQFGF